MKATDNDTTNKHITAIIRAIKRAQEVAKGTRLWQGATLVARVYITRAGMVCVALPTTPAVIVDGVSAIAIQDTAMAQTIAHTWEEVNVKFIESLN